MKIIKALPAGSAFYYPFLCISYLAAAHTVLVLSRGLRAAVFTLLSFTRNDINDRQKTRRGIAVPSLHSFESPFSKGQGKERTKSTAAAVLLFYWLILFSVVLALSGALSHQLTQDTAMLFIGHCILNGGQCGENHTDGRRNGDQEEHGGSVLTGAGTTVIAQEICAALQASFSFKILASL